MSYTLLMGHNMSDGIGDAMHVLNVWRWYTDTQKTRNDLPELIVCISGDIVPRILINAIDMQLINYDRTKLNNLSLDIIEEIMEQNPHLILYYDMWGKDSNAKSIFEKLAVKIDDVTHGFEMSTVKLSKKILEEAHNLGNEDAIKIINKIEELALARKFYRYLEFNAAEIRKHHSMEKLLTSDDPVFTGEEQNLIDYFKDQAGTIKSMGVGYHGVSGIESTGIPLRIAKKDTETKIKALLEIKDSNLVEVFQKYGYIKGQNEIEFLKETLIVPGYLQGGIGAGYDHYFKTIFESPIAKNGYKNIIFIVNKFDEVSYPSYELSDNVFVYQTFLELEDYNKILTVAQAFCISSGDNTFINALNYSLIPIIAYKNDKAFQLAVMWEYIKHKELFNTKNLNHLCNWLDKHYSLTSEEPKIFTDPYEKIFFLKESLADEPKANKNLGELEAELQTEEKVLDAFISNFSKELLAEWIDFIHYLNQNENLFDKITAIIADEAPIPNTQYIDDSVMLGGVEPESLIDMSLCSIL